MMKECFEEIKDERRQALVQHDLYEIIALTIAGVAGNCDGWDEIEDFCCNNEDWLREHMGLKLEHGVPSAQTFARVWGLINPNALKASPHNSATRKNVPFAPSASFRNLDLRFE